MNTEQRQNNGHNSSEADSDEDNGSDKGNNKEHRIFVHDGLQSICRVDTFRDLVNTTDPQGGDIIKFTFIIISHLEDSSFFPEAQDDSDIIFRTDEGTRFRLSGEEDLNFFAGLDWVRGFGFKVFGYQDDGDTDDQTGDEASKGTHRQTPYKVHDLPGL